MSYKLMSTRRKSIRIAPHDRQFLVKLYSMRRVPVDQYEERHTELVSLCELFNEGTGRSDSPEDLLHYMRSQRKQGRWVTLNGLHVTREPQELTAEEKEILVKIYDENVASMSLGSDNLAYEPEIASMIAKEFANETGRIIPAPNLIAAITAMRKRGHLPRVGPALDSVGNIGFDDIDQIDAM